MQSDNLTNNKKCIIINYNQKKGKYKMKTMKELTIDSMIDQLCCKFGFEAKETISFCTFCDKTNNFIMIKNRFNKLINN